MEESYVPWVNRCIGLPFAGQVSRAIHVPDHFDHGTDVILDLEDYEPKPMRQALCGGNAWGRHG